MLNMGAMKPGMIIILLVFVLSLVACGGANVAAPQSTTETSVQFSWFHDVEFIGFYEAERAGEYAKGNLAVRLDGGGFDDKGAYIDPVERVVSGADDFGVAGADQILRARAAGKPVVAVATIYQRSPVVLISLSDQNINRPSDLVGKRVGTQPSTITVGIMYEALLKSQNITAGDFTAKSDINFGNVDALFNGDVDVMQGFITNQAIQAKLRSENVNLMLISDYGIDFYSNVIFTTEDTIKNRPQLVEAFVRATVNGMQEAIANPDSAASSALDKYILGTTSDENARDVQMRGMLASVPLINPVGSKPGLMNLDVWSYAQSVLKEQGLLDVEQDVSEAFTLEFLNKVYGS